MVFNPSTAFKEAFTQAMVLQASRTGVAYALGDRSEEEQINTNKDYRVANPTVTVQQNARNRTKSGNANGGVGGMADYMAFNTDMASLEWIVVEATGNQNFRGKIDQRDIDYVSPVTLEFLSRKIGLQIGRWVDDHIWGQVSTGVASGQTTALPDKSGAMGLSKTTQKITGGNNSDQQGYADGYVDWIDDLNLKIALANIDPAFAAEDSAVPVVVMGPGQFKVIEDRLLEKYDNTDEIVTDILPNEPGFFGGGRWRGRIRGVDIVTTTSPTFVHTGAGTDDTMAIATLPQTTWHNAIKRYPLHLDPPDADSAKYRFAQELEAWVKVVETSYIWRLTGDVI